MKPIKPEIRGELETPLIVITPHSTAYISEELKYRLAIGEDDVRRFTDLYAEIGRAHV